MAAGIVHRFVGPLPDLVWVLAVALSSGVGLALGLRLAVLRHREIMRALDVGETEVRYQAVVDSGDRRWNDTELRLLLAAERDRETNEVRAVPRLPAATNDAAPRAPRDPAR